MPFDPERISYDRALDKELTKIRRSLLLIERNFTIQLELANKQMQSDIARVYEHIQLLQEFIDAP